MPFYLCPERILHFSGINKKGDSLSRPITYAEGGIRTHTGLHPHGPEPCASTSFTTSAGKAFYSYLKFSMTNLIKMRLKVKLFVRNLTSFFHLGSLSIPNSFLT